MRVGRRSVIDADDLQVEIERRGCSVRVGRGDSNRHGADIALGRCAAERLMV